MALWVKINTIQNKEFKQSFNKLIEENKLVIDRLKRTSHPRHRNIPYPLNYGYFEEMISKYCRELNIWKGKYE